MRHLVKSTHALVSRRRRRCWLAARRTSCRCGELRMHSGPTMHWGHTCQGLLLAACETSRRGLDGQGQRSASHTFQQGSVMYRRCGMWCMGVALAVEPEAGIASLNTPIGSRGIFGHFSGVWASVEPAGVACLSVRPSDLKHLRGRASTASLGFRTMANSNSLHRRRYCCLSRSRSRCPCGKGWPDIVSYAARLRLCSSTSCPSSTKSLCQ